MSTLGRNRGLSMEEGESIEGRRGQGLVVRWVDRET